MLQKIYKPILLSKHFSYERRSEKYLYGYANFWLSLDAVGFISGITNQWYPPINKDTVNSVIDQPHRLIIQGIFVSIENTRVNILLWSSYLFKRKWKFNQHGSTNGIRHRTMIRPDNFVSVWLESHRYRNAKCPIHTYIDYVIVNGVCKNHVLRKMKRYVSLPEEENGIRWKVLIEIKTFRRNEYKIR